MNLLQTAKALEGYRLDAVDGEIGAVEAFYFDAVNWAVRYLVVNIGGHFMDGRVLVSPVAIGEIDADSKTMDVELTRRQIENSPPVSTARPLSRQYEQSYYHYYGWPPYWDTMHIEATPPLRRPIAAVLPEYHEETYLRGTAQLKGYGVAALDGDIGRVEDFIIDTQYWVIRYLDIAVRNNLSGKHVLINVSWVGRVNGTKQTVSVGMTRAAIKSAE
ncbi:MAG: PRC-barrel domain-containing protein [Gammaproteobacteria bacterium]|nr:PRC-barrel domain-containing protein [Gammaproteobacteria bacterium]